MSIGQPCRHCLHGKMRPIQFSWDQAVVLCDNKKCKSLLDISPSECMIKRDILHPTHQELSSEFGLQCLVNDGSSRSSSGVYSEARSSLPSPAQSGKSVKSVTDEEVEFLLKASYAPLSHKGTTVASSVSSGAVTHTQVSPKVQNSKSDSSKYDTFFELLGSLDLEPQSQPVNPEPQTETKPMETSFDIVTAELEGWMKDFDFASSCLDTNPSDDPSVGGQRPPDDALRIASPKVSTNMQGPPIPSQRSAFIPIEAPKEYAATFNTEEKSVDNSSFFHNSSAVNNETQNYVQECEHPRFPMLLENEFVNGNLSNAHTRFMSPTASAASEDSGYNEENGKVILGAEPLVSEESLKVSSKTNILYSSLKTQNSSSFSKFITQTNEDSLKDLIQNNLEWPVMPGMCTLTVLPAMIATEKGIVNSPQEPQRSPLPSQTTGSGETCSTVQDIRERVDLCNEEQAEVPQIPSGVCQENEHENMSLGDCENMLTNDICITVQDEREQDDLSTEEIVSLGDCENMLINDLSTTVQDEREQDDMHTEETMSLDHENILTNDICTTAQDEREQDDLSTEESKSLEHHENVSHEILAGSPSESSHTSVTSPTPESTVSEGSSHSISSDVKALPENVDASKLCSSASSSFPENESKNKRRQETRRNLRVRKCSNSSKSKHVVSDADNTFLDKKISKVRGKRKRRGVAEIKERARRKDQNPKLRSKSEKRGSLNKASVGKLTKRPGNVGKVQLKEHLPTSSGENYFLENIAEELLGGGDSIALPGCQSPDGGANHLSRRGRNLSPRKLLIGHVNKDPWSVMELSLEELTIEIVVEGGQREASSHSDKAAKCNAQLQQLVSLFSQESESEVSPVPPKDTVQDVPSEASEGAFLEKENGECLSKGENSSLNESEEKTLIGDANQNLTANSGQNLQTVENESCTENSLKEIESEMSYISTTDMKQDTPIASEGTSLDSKYEEWYFEGKNLGANDSEEKTAHGDGNLNKMEIRELNLQTLENQSGSKKTSKDSESEVSQVPTEDTIQIVPSTGSNGASLDKKNEECVSKVRNSGIIDSKEKAVHENGNQNLMGSRGQKLQNLKEEASTKNLAFTNTDEAKLKDPSLDTFHRVPCKLGHSRLNIINESKGLSSVVQENEQLVQRSDTDSIFQLDIDSIGNIEHAAAAGIGFNSFSEKLYSTENEDSAPNVEIGSNNLFSKEARSAKQLDPSSLKEGSSGGAERIYNVKQADNKQLAEGDDNTVELENCELDTEQFVSEETGHPSFTLDDLNATDKTAVEAIKRQCISVSGSDLKILRTVECVSLGFDIDCDKNISASETIATEKCSLGKPYTSTLDQSCDLKLDSISVFPSTSREASPLHFLNPTKCKAVRSWIGDEDSVSVEEDEYSAEGKLKKDNGSSKSCPDFKSRLSSSVYFQSLVEDMDFDEHFFQCPVQEHPRNTFSEHLKSSLLFGETASNDFCPSHVDLSEEQLPEFKISSKSNRLNMSLPQTYNHFAGSEPSTAYTQVPVPLPSSNAQPLSTSIFISNSPHTVSSIVGKKMPGEKLLMIPKNPEVIYTVASSYGMNSNLAPSAPLPPYLQSPLPCVLPEHSGMESGGKGVECQKPDDVIKLGKHISNLDEMFPESGEEKQSCIEKVADIDSSTKCVNVKLMHSRGFTGLSGEGVGREQGNLSSSECTEPDKSCENSAALDTQDQESKLDQTLKTQQVSKLCPTDFTDVVSNTITPKQTSLCYCSGVVGDCKVCECNTGNFEQKENITVHCREQTNHETDSVCTSDGDADELPTISLDSDDEIHITVARKAIDHHSSTQAGRESVTCDENCTTEAYSVNDCVYNCFYSDESIEAKLTENCMTKRDLVSDIHVTQCHNDEKVETELNDMKDHKESHRLDDSGLKRKADDQGEAFKKQKLHDTLTDRQNETYVNTQENQPEPLCTAHCGALMCGILDNSVVHDESCFSSSHKNFQDFASEGVNNEREFQTVKTYTGSRKQCSASQCKESVSSILRSSVGNDNDYSVCSSTKEMTNLTVQDTTLFNYDFDFGSLKVGPQYANQSHLRIENDVKDLDFFQVNSLHTGFLAPLISPTESLASTPELEQEESDSEHCVSQESDTSQEDRKNESIDRETVKHKQSLLHEKIGQNTSEPAVAENNDGFKAKNACIVSQTVSQVSSTNDTSKNVNKFPVLGKDGQLLNVSVRSDNSILTKFGQNCNYSNVTPQTSIDAAGSQKLKKIIIFRKPKQSSQSDPQKSPAFINTSSTTNLVPNSPLSASASPTVSTCGLPDAPAKTITCEPLPRAQYDASVTASHSRVILPTFMNSNSQNMAPHPLAKAHPSLASSNIAIIKFASSGIKKQEPQIDCQNPALPSKSTALPPALDSSDANVSPSLVYQPSESACMIDSSIRNSPKRVASPAVSLNCMQDDSKLIAQNEKDMDTEEEGGNMLKKVKMGTNGPFYLRPTPALKNAILKMRENRPKTEEEGSSSEYMILPDGTPISHPIFIPKRNEVQVVRPKRSEGQMARLKRRIRKKKQKQVKALVEEKVKESLKSCEDEIPKMIVIYAQRSFHICQIDVTENR